MGMDIHMNIVYNGEVIAKDIFDGRNTNWFLNLQGCDNDFGYSYLPTVVGVSPQATEEHYKAYENRIDNTYFGFYYIKVKDFLKWFIKYRPDLEAGWVSTYDKWLVERKHAKLDDIEIYTYLPDDVNLNDMHFIEVEKEYENSDWLYHYLIDNKIPEDADINYYFDN